jgi:hypothetical protein
VALALVGAALMLLGVRWLSPAGNGEVCLDQRPQVGDMPCGASQSGRAGDRSGDAPDGNGRRIGSPPHGKERRRRVGTRVGVGAYTG